MPRDKFIDATTATPFRAPHHPLDGASADSVAEATRAGFEAGLARGEAQARASFAQAQAEWAEQAAATLAALHGIEAEWTSTLRDKLLGLAISAAEAIVRAHVAVDDGVAVRLVDDLLAQAVREVSCKLRLHPDDLSAIQRARTELVGAGRVTLVADPSIARGGALLETAQEQLDGQIETQLAKLKDALEEHG